MVNTEGNTVSAFLTKLWKLVEDPRYNNLISWALDGKSFIIHNQTRFSKDLLPLYFKHNNMASFIRQLNMYGFRKSTSIENSGLKADTDKMEFYHQYFLKGQESKLEFIKRKVCINGW
jgi:heat shock transcription factor 1